MKNKILFILVLVSLLSFSIKVSANEICSRNGYTVLTINGIFTDENGAKLNKNQLSYRLPPTFNNQPLYVDYVYNPTHLGGLGDITDITAQALFNEKSDYDLTEILNDASKKVATQKFLLVGHSQGNFYTNNFYDAVADKIGGVPSQSIGVYDVANPASRVAGGGKYLTSDTDKAIIDIAGKFFSVMPANTHIALANGDDKYGHDFSSVYLKYRGDQIISDIKDSLNKLNTNNIQDTQSACIAPPQITLSHKIESVALAVADPLATITKNIIIGAYDSSAFVMNTSASAIAWLYNNSISLVKTIGGFSNNNLASVENSNIITDNQEASIESNVNESNNEPVVENIPVENNQTETVDQNSNEEEVAVTQEPDAEVTTNPQQEQITPVVTEDLSVNDQPVVTLGSGGGTVPSSDNTELEEPSDPLDTVAPVITILGDNPSIVTVGSTYVDAGATATDDIDGAVAVNTTGIDAINTSTVGNYIITYTASDVAGNISTAIRNVKVASYKYIPQDSFGKNNGDGNNWQIWEFTGSNVYDWSDTYVDNYLREQFKIITYLHEYSCSQCLQRGIFNHNPQDGFESSDVSLSLLENNPQGNTPLANMTYDVAMQWDATGYTYTISHNSIIDSTGHTNVSNVNENTWVGWDGTFDDFKTSPTGRWLGVVFKSPMDRTGGDYMILQPYPVYKDQSTDLTSTLSIPNKGAYAGTGINPTQGRKNLTPFNFQVIYTDKNNIAPQNVTLHMINTTSGNSIPDVLMQKINQGSDITSDGNFTNGEAYVVNNLLYDTGEYNYYFTAADSSGNIIRIPENYSLSFKSIPSAYTYIPKYTFGTNNGDGNDWQDWAFNGSDVYDWSDTYANNYLKEQFTILSYGGGSWCSACLQRGIFNHDPQKGFELGDVSISNLENTPQDNMNKITYDIVIQWDATGYTYTISHNSIIDSTGHTNVSNVNENTWVGWDDSYNNFQTFPSGTWYGAILNSPLGLIGGSNMILQPYPVYVYSESSQNQNTEPDIIPPTVTSYTLDGNADNITTNPISHNLTIVINASENVNWTSIKIENQDDPTFYKYFYPGSSCDGLSTCTEIWKGLLSSGGLLKDGIYKIKVHMKDLSNNDYEEYLSPYVITVDSTQ